MSDIRLEGISKYFRQAAAVEKLDLLIEDRSFHTLLGPSGCGKTTTLRMIAGLEQPTEGSITIGGRIVYSSREGITLPPAKRDIGLIFQDYALWPHMTVTANVAFGLEAKRVGRLERLQRIQSILKRVQLDGLEDRHPSELSGGQQQRVAMARMLVVEPEVLLMDEPLSNLDAKLRIAMRSELKRLHREIGATTVYVTHDQREALAMSDKITVMYRGRVQQSATPTGLYERPANLFVAGFIGSPTMNLLPGRVREISAGSLVVELDEMKSDPIRLDPVDNLRAGDAVILGVRAEDILVERDDADCRPIRGVVRTVMPAGAESFVEIGRENALLTARVERKFAFNPDGSIHFSIGPQAVHLFGAGTGVRLN